MIVNVCKHSLVHTTKAHECLLYLYVYMCLEDPVLQAEGNSELNQTG